ncbi:MAG: hypothetical protein AB4368_28985 [Xenococcaceae cyanobacterium]
MNKHDEWFKSLIEAFQKDPSWDIALKKTTSKHIPDREQKSEYKQKIKAYFYLGT